MNGVVKERPILFNGAMVRAILSGAKTQTRRLVKPQPPSGHNFAGFTTHSTCRADEGKAVWGAGDVRAALIGAHRVACPFGQPGDRLWVRESFWGCDLPGYGDQPCVVYDDEWQGTDYRPAEARPWARKFGRIPAIHMPREACRLVLEITDVRVERLQTISEADAMAEGARNFPDLRMASPSASPCRWSMESPSSTDQCLSTARYAFANQFCKQHGTAPKGVIDQRPWDSNPWVWVIELKRVEA